MKPLLSASQMSSVQRLSEAGMQVVVVIKRPALSSDDLGDGAFDVAPRIVAQPASVLRRGKLYGYLRQTGGDTTGGMDTGALVTSSTFELGVPVGTDARARDIAEVGGRVYYVQDVRDDETWPAMTNLTLRRRH